MSGLALQLALVELALFMHKNDIKQILQAIPAPQTHTTQVIHMLHLVVTTGRMWQQIRLWVTRLSGKDFTLLLLLLLQPAVLGQVKFLHNNAW